MPEVGEYQIIREGSEKVLRINYEGSSFTPSIEDDKVIMSRVFDILLEVGKVSKIIFLQREEYEYDWAQVRLLLELVDAYTKLVKEENILNFGALGLAPECQRFLPGWYDFLRSTILHQLKEDPIGAFVELVRRHREEVIKQAHPPAPGYETCVAPFVNILQHAIDVLGNTTLLKLVAGKLPGFKPGDRTLYREHFRPSIRPHFMYTKLVTAFPPGAEELASYKIAEGTEVLILKVPQDIRPLYHIIPPEFRLTEDRYALLTEAREIMAEHRPQRSEFIDPARTREIFLSVERDLLADLARSKGVKLSYSELEELAKILLRYTIGFGLIEVVLSDPNIQDVVVNAPLGTQPISLIHADFGECRTNITPLPKEGDSWATKLRLISGRPFDEANPILDSDLLLPHARARVAALQAPLSPLGYAFAFRRHRDKSWTLPLFIKAGMLTPLAAGLISFLVDGARTILIAGTRSAGKTSLLGALMVEIPRINRILSVEDTLELPISQLRGLNYDILSMKTRSVITGAEAEVPAEQAIRTALRLGDSALIIGEVRSLEARALYEAMRIGALAKVVAGTIHGASPYDVYDRVVNDLGVPKTSFKATDIIMVANTVTSPSGLERWRRLTQISEVRKLWTEDPIIEKGFADLMVYNAAKDIIEPTDILIEGESETLKAVGGRVREWAGNWDAIWQNIELRAKIKQAIVDAANKTKIQDLLEAPFVVASNDEFHRLCAIIAEEVGFTDPKRVYAEWSNWLKQRIKKMKGS
ncbi:MAG: type II/IV secretion system ATPase subunit [Candidatus Nanoarchaeia archaeon]